MSLNDRRSRRDEFVSEVGPFARMRETRECFIALLLRVLRALRGERQTSAALVIHLDKIVPLIFRSQIHKDSLNSAHNTLCGLRYLTRDRFNVSHFILSFVLTS